MDPLHVSGPIQAPREFKYVDGQSIKDVDASRSEIADKIDTSKNGIIEADELKAYLKKQDILRDPAKCSVDEDKIVGEFKDFLENKPLMQAAAYHTYDAMVDELKDMEKKNPDLCKTVSIGKTVEGRDIWALKLSKGAQGDTGNKPGVMFTGLTHAREWMSMEVPLHLAHGLVDGYAGDEAIKKRLNDSEIWVIPCVNPDGYEYSRTENSWWRKNRNPVEAKGSEANFEGNIAGTPGREGAIGVDLNRNADDGNPEHIEMYRPKGDTPGSTYDDSGASDDPFDDTYRGKTGASENETKAVFGLEFSHPNIKGVIDFHSYGEMLLYPWGHVETPPENLDTYKELGKKMNAAMGNSYRLMQSADLYPSTGSTDNVHHANKRLTYTIELGRSFQPAEKDIAPMCKKLFPALNTFVDYVIDHKDSIPWPDPKTA